MVGRPWSRCAEGDGPSDRRGSVSHGGRVGEISCGFHRAMTIYYGHSLLGIIHGEDGSSRNASWTSPLGAVWVAYYDTVPCRSLRSG